MNKIFHIFISIFVSIAIFMAVYSLFSQIGDKIKIPLYIPYDEPVLVGGGRTSYEVDGEGTALGSIALYFSCLVAYLTFNSIMHFGLSWFTNLIRLNIIFITFGVLIQFTPLIMIALIYMKIGTIPYYAKGIINISLEILFLYINWKYTYHLYSRKKSILNGYKLWAVLELHGKYYIVIEAKSSKDVLELAEKDKYYFSSLKLETENIRECEVMGNLLLKSELNIAGYMKLNQVVFKNN